MECLEEEQEREQRHELGRKIVSAEKMQSKLCRGKWHLSFQNYLLEDGEGEAGFGNSIPGPLEKMLKFGCPEATEEDLAHEFAEEDDKDKRLNVDHGHTEMKIHSKSKRRKPT